MLQVLRNRLQNTFLSSGLAKPLKFQALQMTSGEAEDYNILAGTMLHLWSKETNVETEVSDLVVILGAVKKVDMHLEVAVQGLPSHQEPLSADACDVKFWSQFP